MDEPQQKKRKSPQKKPYAKRSRKLNRDDVERSPFYSDNS